MSVGARLREERLRLGMSQPAFAGLAGVTKGAVVKWEKDAAAPNALALIAFAEAGADVLYVLTGRHTFDFPENIAPYVEVQLATIRREVLGQAYQRLPGETGDQAEKRCLDWHANTLSNLLRDNMQLAPHELRDEVAQLLDVVTNAASRDACRAAAFAAERLKLKELREQLLAWMRTGPYVPGNSVAHLLVMLALDYGIPIKRLVELVHEMHEEAECRASEDAEEAE